MEVHRSDTEPWRVTPRGDGRATMTGGRLRRVLSYVQDEDFCFTYGDGLADIDIGALIDFHRQQGTAATVDRGAAARPLRHAGHRGHARARVRGEAARGKAAG